MNSFKYTSNIFFQKKLCQFPILNSKCKTLVSRRSFTISNIYNIKLNEYNLYADKKDPGAKVIPDPKAGKSTIVCKPSPKPSVKKTDGKAPAKAAAPKAAAPKAAAPKAAAPKAKIATIDKKAVEKMEQLQIHYQKKDGKPIFLKAGTRDLILYRTTCALAVLGLAGCLYFYEQLTFN